MKHISSHITAPAPAPVAAVSAATANDNKGNAPAKRDDDLSPHWPAPAAVIPITISTLSAVMNRSIRIWGPTLAHRHTCMYTTLHAHTLLFAIFDSKCLKTRHRSRTARTHTVSRAANQHGPCRRTQLARGINQK